MGFLAEVVGEVRADLARRPPDEAALRAAVRSAPASRSFDGALRGAAAERGIALVAEVKRASPSAGPIAERDPAEQASAYGSAGAAAVSVLTEPRHFGGSLDDLRAVRAAVDIPVLRKDFLVHPTQLLEARAAGADAVLLIASALSDAELRELLAEADGLGLSSLVETHAADDLDRALEAGARIIGVNARDLESLEVDPERALALLATIPEDRVAVLESGISAPDQVRRAATAGATAVLVGEALMRAADPAAKVRELLEEVHP